MKKAIGAAVRGWLILAGVLLALVGCGNGGGGAGEPVSTPPTITAAPAATTVSDGQAASFSVTASGTAPLAYQWLRGGVEIPGATATIYALPAATLADSGAGFSVRVSNGAASVTTGAAVLTVTAVAPNLTASPVNASVIEGQGATFSAVASGSSPLVYQWERDGVAIAGASATAYTLPAAALSDHGAAFRVVVSNAAGRAVSAAAVLSVSARPVAPQITTQPQNAAVGVGQTASFGVTAIGTAPLGYQWKRNGSDITGATQSSYTTPPVVTGDDGARYSVLVSNAGGSVTSADALLSVSVPPAASGQARLAIGSSHVVAVRADGSVLAWGSNGAGQLGSGAVLPGSVARLVATNAVSVAAGQFESLALRSDGVVVGWGRKFAGTTIIGGEASVFGTDVASPAATGYPAGATHVATAASNFGFVRRNDGTVWHVPSLGPALTGATVNQVGRQVDGIANAAALGVTGGAIGLPTAIDADGRVWRITFNSLDVATRRATATPIPGLSSIVAVACTDEFFGCLALAANGAVWRWSTSAAPAEVSGLPLAAGVAVTTGSWHVLGADGSVWSWGNGARSGIAGRQNTNLTAPERVTGIGPVAEIAGGATSVLVRLRDGSVWGWGLNASGELGTGDSISAQTPVQASGIQLN